MLSELERLRTGERWLAWVRLGAVPFAIFQSAVSGPYPPGRAAWSWVTTGVLAAGAVVFLVLARRDLAPRQLTRLGAAALAFDFAVVSSFILALSFQRGTPIRQTMTIVLIEAAFRYGMRGGLGLVVVSVPVVVAFEWLRHDHFDDRFRFENVTLQLGLEVLIALVVGWLVQLLRTEARTAAVQAREAEHFRDQLGRRADLLEAANRCARSLGSSLELDRAFGAFIRELQGLIPFDRTAIVLADEGHMHVMATAGVGHDQVLNPGTTMPKGALIEEIMRTAETVYRRDLTDARYPEEVELARLGLRSRIVSPLLLGARPIGILAILRSRPDAFGPDEIELATLLGRLVATAVQNIRSYEAERETVEELRRLSALRADFVSLVSHELRSPMAAVIGAARTLQERWRELSPDQRTSFLALIGDETSRLATLIGDVLDTSRIEAGTFSYSFSDVDLAELVRDTVATARVGQDEVEVTAKLPDRMAPVRGDRERLRQVLVNLIDNAVKYSPPGDEVEVSAWWKNGHAGVTVRDHGPGIPREQQGLIFEKFGRANVGGGKPGTGLGLFIARSIAEAHGGSLDVRSAPGQGTAFTLRLPLEE
ncbi:MAG TPA: ATP-binding protein [Gaiellaceae bacterium]|nr:ATP-binding protein [Gaiellaceae bacterium]